MVFGRWLLFIFFFIGHIGILKADDEQIISPIEVNDPFFQQSVKSNEIKVMSYNILNLFDTKHDQDFFDYTFLPKNHPKKTEKCNSLRPGYYKRLCSNLDWTQPRLKKKMNQLKEVISGHGPLPDILALQEVENEEVVSMLANSLGYNHYIVTDYKGRRGIDVAILFRTRRLKYIDQSTVPAPGRDPLRVQFRLIPSNERFFVYVNHWQAQMAPKKNRIKASKALRKDITQLNNDYNGIINTLLLGDFNVTFKEENEVFRKILQDSTWNNKLTEIHQLAIRKHPQFKKYMPQGSYLYSVKNWERFDRFFVNRSLLNGRVKALTKSYRIIYSSFITAEHVYLQDKEDPNSQKYLVRYPLSYNFLEKPDRPMGYSDHLPISLIIKVN